MNTEKINGLLVVDKPTHMTSRDAVNRVQGLFPRKTRIGHAGTLDPLATGVLVICIGKATRLIEYVQDMEKEYVTDLVLGAVSDTDDGEGKISIQSNGPIPDQQTVEEVLQKFVGVVEQVPPNYSAAKIGGKRAYHLARKGEAVALEARKIQIDTIKLLEYQYPHLRLHIRCGKGTYIRSIARDLGQKLGCGAYVGTLRRLRIGCFTEEIAVALPEKGQREIPQLLPISQAVSQLPHMEISPDQAKRFQLGQAISFEVGRTLFEEDEPEVALFSSGGLVGIGKWNSNSNLVSPVKVL